MLFHPALTLPCPDGLTPHFYATSSDISVKCLNNGSPTCVNTKEPNNPDLLLYVHSCREKTWLVLLNKCLYIAISCQLRNGINPVPSPACKSKGDVPQNNVS